MFLLNETSNSEPELESDADRQDGRILQKERSCRGVDVRRSAHLRRAVLPASFQGLVVNRFTNQSHCREGTNNRKEVTR